MERWLRLRSSPPDAGLPDGAGEEVDVRFSEELAARIITDHSRPGAVVFDPFAGYGTTLAVAERLGRRAIGIELLADRAEHIRSHITADALVITGDARQLARFEIGPVDLVVTSPPYMTRNDHPEDPLTGYLETGADYARYLNELRSVFGQTARLLTGDGQVVINVANLRYAGTTTTLAWDVAAVVSEVLTFERELVVVDDALPSHVTQEYCLIFSR